MSVGEWVALIVAGGLGAGARYLLDGAVMRGRRDAFPLGILLVNIIGSFALGVVTGLGHAVAPTWIAIIGVGMLGGFTTFSAVSAESVLLGRRGKRGWAWFNLLGTLLLCIAAAALGVLLGGLFPR